MPQPRTSDPNLKTTITHTDTKWFGNEVMFKVGNREIKLWHIIALLILLYLFSNGKANGKTNGK